MSCQSFSFHNTDLVINVLKQNLLLTSKNEAKSFPSFSVGLDDPGELLLSACLVY